MRGKANSLLANKSFILDKYVFMVVPPSNYNYKQMEPRAPISSSAERLVGRIGKLPSGETATLRKRNDY